MTIVQVNTQMNVICKVWHQRSHSRVSVSVSFGVALTKTFAFRIQITRLFTLGSENKAVMHSEQSRSKSLKVAHDDFVRPRLMKPLEWHVPFMIHAEVTGRRPFSVVSPSIGVTRLCHTDRHAHTHLSNSYSPVKFHRLPLRLPKWWINSSFHQTQFFIRYLSQIGAMTNFTVIGSARAKSSKIWPSSSANKHPQTFFFSFWILSLWNICTTANKEGIH